MSTNVSNTTPVKKPVAPAAAPAQSKGAASAKAAATQKAQGDVFTSSKAKVQQSCTVPDIPAIRTLQSVHQISDDCLGYWNGDMPSWQYQYTEWKTRTVTNSQGQRVQEQYAVTKYNWGAAFADVRAKLQSVAAVAGSTNDSRCQEIARIANQALTSNDWQYFFDEGSDASRYAQLKATLNSINAITQDTPNEPQDTVNQMNGAIGNAGKAIQDLRTTLKDPTLSASNLASKTQAKIDYYNQKANNIPWWHYVLIFGFFQKGSDHGNASRLAQDLKTVQTSNPDALQQQLDALAGRATSVNQQACNTNTIDGASQLQSNAQPITDGANGVRDKANDQNNQGKDLSNSVNQPNN